MKNRLKLKISPATSAVLRRMGEANPAASWEQLTERLIAIGLEMPTVEKPDYLPTSLRFTLSEALVERLADAKDPQAALEAALERGARLVAQTAQTESAVLVAALRQIEAIAGAGHDLATDRIYSLACGALNYAGVTE